MSTNFIEKADSQPSLSDSGDDEYIHSVSFFQRLLDILTPKIPRALCGVLLEGDPDRPEPGFNAPRCPECTARA